MAGKAGVDIFTKQQFEDALPRHKETGAQLWSCAGLVDGEWTYQMQIGKDERVIIEIRSSVGGDGRSAGKGDNSIRAYLVWFDPHAKAWRPLGSKVQRWVTRQTGWQDRLTEMLRTLYMWRIKAGDCPKCGEPRKIFKVGKPGPNHGRVYAKCMKHSEFRWITEAGK